MPASPASIPNDCFSWHTGCLVDIDSPSANERNLETSHRLIQRPATRIESLGHCLHPGSTVPLLSLACHRRNLKGSARGNAVWWWMATPTKSQSANDRAARPRPAEMSRQFDRCQTSLATNFNITSMSPVQRVP